MEQRPLGKTGLSVSVLGYGCGAIGGLMVKGSAAEQDRAIGRAIDQGITYFDTASAYGDGVSESNLGRALKALGAEVIVGTKVRIRGPQRMDIAGTSRNPLMPAWPGLAAIAWMSFTFMNPSPNRARRQALPLSRFCRRPCRHSANCATRARFVSMALQGLAMRPCCAVFWMKAASPRRKCPTTS